MHQDAGIKDDNSETMIEKVVRFGHQPALIITDQESDRYDNAMIGADLSVYSRRARATLSFVPGADLDIVYALQIPFRLSCWAARHVTHFRKSTKRIYAKCGSK